MTNRSQLVRYSATKAFGEIADQASEDLPSLVYEVFLLNLTDPYVIVHTGAIRALRRLPLPERERDEAIWRVALLINHYSTTHSDDNLLSECIERFIELCEQKGPLSKQTVKFLISTIGGIQPQNAAKLVKYNGSVFRENPGYFDLVVKLIGEASVYDWDLSELVEELSFAPKVEIQRLAGAIQTAAIVGSQRSSRLIDELLFILSLAGAWSASVEIMNMAISQIEDTKWDRPHKLRTLAKQKATELELASLTGQIDQVVACAVRWQELQQEIRIDDEGRKGLFFPF